MGSDNGSGFSGLFNIGNNVLNSVNDLGNQITGKYYKEDQIKDDLRMREDERNGTIAAIKEQDAKTALTKKRDEDRAKQKALAASSGGRSSTILTDPSQPAGLGVVDQNSKTILGG